MTPTPTPVVEVIEDFEGARKMNWFTPDSRVFSYNEASEQVYNGNQSFRIEYAKTDTYQFIGADPIQSKVGNFQGAQALQVAVHGQVTILLKLENENQPGVGIEVGRQNATNPNGWSLIRFNLAGLDDEFLSNVKMLFFPDPGDVSTSGVFYLDDIALLKQP